MNIFLILAHPEPKSFNGTLFEAAQTALEAAGHTVKTSDLYRMNFDPISSRKNFTTVRDPDYFKPQNEEMYATEQGGFAPDLEQELQKLEWCDLMIWQFPLWWFSVPAILKGWVDRVYAMGRTYGGGRIYSQGVFRGKRALLSLTTGGPESAYLPGGFNGDMQSILRPIQRGMLQFVGFDVLSPHVVYGAARLSDDDRQQLLEQYTARLAKIHLESAIEVGEY